jgi:hypothetical protein
MLDGSGNGLHGAVGTDVQAGGAAYRFPFTRPNMPPANPQRLVQVPPRQPAEPGDRRLRGRVPSAHHPLLRQHRPEGGKLNYDQVEITCDYFAGELDDLRIETS